MAKRVLLINGPNLNLLGTREPHIYGSTTLNDVEEAVRKLAAKLDVEIDTFQSNHEGKIVDRIQEAAGFQRPAIESDGRRGTADVIIINPGGFTHTSVAIRDALLGVDIPFVELHVSNIHAREQWRHHSYFSDKAVAVICGLGAYGYQAAVEFCAKHIKLRRTANM